MNLRMLVIYCISVVMHSKNDEKPFAWQALSDKNLFDNNESKYVFSLVRTKLRGTTIEHLSSNFLCGIVLQRI